MTTRTTHRLLAGAALLAVTACGGGATASTAPPTAAAGAPAPGSAGSGAPVPGAPATSTPTPGSTATAVPGGAAPTAAPGSTTTGLPAAALEADPAVRALRAWYAAAARAVNADDLDLPELAALSTPQRQELNASAFAEDRGAHVPGPTPFTPVGATGTGPQRTVQLCAVDGGWVLDAPGGTPTGPDQVVPLRAELVEQAGAWRVDGVYTTSRGTCAGVPIERRPFP